MTDPQSIARLLSPAQRKALLWLDPDETRARKTPGRIAVSMQVLWERRLVAPARYDDWWHITPLGAQVRAHLAQEASHGG